MGKISQWGRPICHYISLVKAFEDSVDVAASGTQIKYMRNGAVNGKLSGRRRINRPGVS